MTRRLTVRQFGRYRGVLPVPVVTPVLAPTVSSVTPNSGSVAGGTAITNLAGTGFQVGSTVTFNGVAATSVVFVSSTKLTCTTPASVAGAKNIVVTNPDTRTSGTSGNGLFTYLAAAPTVTAITPNTGSTAGGDAITNLAGTGFVNGATVKIGGASATSVVFVSSTKLTCVTPAGSSGAKDVVVTNPDTQTGTGTGLFTYASSFTPADLNPMVFWSGQFVSGGLGGYDIMTAVSTRLSGGGGGHNVSGDAQQTTGSSAPVGVGGYPYFNGTNYLDILGETLDTVVGSGNNTVFAVVDIVAITNSDTNPEAGDLIFGDGNSYYGLKLMGAGSNLAVINQYNGGDHNASVSLGTAPISGRYVLCAKYINGTGIMITKNGLAAAPWTAPDGATAAGAFGPPANRAGSVVIGGKAGALRMNATLKALLVDNSAISDADIANLYTWAAGIP